MSVVNVSGVLVDAVSICDWSQDRHRVDEHAADVTTTSANHHESADVRPGIAVPRQHTRQDRRRGLKTFSYVGDAMTVRASMLMPSVNAPTMNIVVPNDVAGSLMAYKLSGPTGYAAVQPFVRLRRRRVDGDRDRLRQRHARDARRHARPANRTRSSTGSRRARAVSARPSRVGSRHRDPQFWRSRALLIRGDAKQRPFARSDFRFAIRHRLCGPGRRRRSVVGRSCLRRRRGGRPHSSRPARATCWSGCSRTPANWMRTAASRGTRATATSPRAGSTTGAGAPTTAPGASATCASATAAGLHPCRQYYQIFGEAGGGE